MNNKDHENRADKRELTPWMEAHLSELKTRNSRMIEVKPSPGLRTGSLLRRVNHIYQEKPHDPAGLPLSRPFVNESGGNQQAPSNWGELLMLLSPSRVDARVDEERGIRPRYDFGKIEAGRQAMRSIQDIQTNARPAAAYPVQTHSESGQKPVSGKVKLVRGKIEESPEKRKKPAGTKLEASATNENAGTNPITDETDSTAEKTVYQAEKQSLRVIPPEPGEGPSSHTSLNTPSESGMGTVPAKEKDSFPSRREAQQEQPVLTAKPPVEITGETGQSEPQRVQPAQNGEASHPQPEDRTGTAAIPPVRPLIHGQIAEETADGSFREKAREEGAALTIRRHLSTRQEAEKAENYVDEPNIRPGLFLTGDNLSEESTPAERTISNRLNRENPEPEAEAPAKTGPDNTPFAAESIRGNNGADQRQEFNGGKSTGTAVPGRPEIPGKKLKLDFRPVLRRIFRRNPGKPSTEKAGPTAPFASRTARTDGEGVEIQASDKRTVEPAQAKKVNKGQGNGGQEDHMVHIPFSPPSGWQTEFQPSEDNVDRPDMRDDIPQIPQQPVDEIQAGAEISAEGKPGIAESLAGAQEKNGTAASSLPGNHSPLIATRNSAMGASVQDRQRADIRVQSKMKQADHPVRIHKAEGLPVKPEHFTRPALELPLAVPAQSRANPAASGEMQPERYSSGAQDRSGPVYYSIPQQPVTYVNRSTETGQPAVSSTISLKEQSAATAAGNPADGGTDSQTRERGATELKALARDIYPYIKRMIMIERERHPNR